MRTSASTRSQGFFEPKADELGVSEKEVYEANLAFFRGSTRTLMHMLQLGAKLGCALGSMCWTLVEFSAPALATSDHPVVIWPMADHNREAKATEPSRVGIKNFLEVRIPVSPRLALLLTWRDGPDDPIPVQGKTHHARNLNAFTVAEAEKQWFFLPKARRPQIRGGAWLPLSSELIGGYSASTARESRFYQEVVSDLQSRMGDGSLKVEISFREQVRPAA